MQVALGKERLKYFAGFYAIAVPGCIIGAIKQKDPKLISPILPLTFMLAFQYDMAYGTMLNRARDEADNLIVTDPYKFYLPAHSGIVTIE
jgi:hypothetical protein